MNTKTQLLWQLFKDSPWLLLLTGSLVFAFNRAGQGITLAFVPLILYWGLHWGAYLIVSAVGNAIGKIDKQLIDAEHGRDISKFTYRTLITGMVISGACIVVADFPPPGWIYVMAVGLLILGMGLGMMLPRFITHTEKRTIP